MSNQRSPHPPTPPAPLRPLRRCFENGQEQVEILDQTVLPHIRRWVRLHCLEDAIHAIDTMQVRGAPLIGIVAAYGIALGLWADASDQALVSISARLATTRPTAVNLAWALARMNERLTPLPAARRAAAAWSEADDIAEENARQNRAIGKHGYELLRQIAAKNPCRPMQLMTHCNAGWLATIEQGTALAPIYAAASTKLPLHVWVSETRPRNQGLLTAWELAEAGVPHTLIADNASGLLILQGRVDAVIVGADRVAANGDVANKVGTSLKALAAHRQGIPFYVAAPGASLDFSAANGGYVPLEVRSEDELSFVTGVNREGQIQRLRQISNGEPIYNPAFDITPAELVTGIITERGVCAANQEALAQLFPEAAART